MPRNVFPRTQCIPSPFRRCLRWRALVCLTAGCLIVFTLTDMKAMLRTTTLARPTLPPLLAPGRRSEAINFLGHEQSASRSIMSIEDGLTGERLADVVAQLDNLPLVYGLDNPPKISDNECVKHPSLFDLLFNNLYWQILHSSNGTFYLYSAFFDNRTALLQKPSVRILGMIDRVAPSVTTHCQLWYEETRAPVVVNVSEYKYIWYKEFGNYRNGILQPYLMTCAVPPAHSQSVPRSVSLVEGRCDKPTNNLRVVNNMPKGGMKEDFAVCVKGMSGLRDNSVRLAEWLELLLLLGADKVFLYDMGVHPNVTRILRLYETRGKVDIKRLTLPGEQPNARGLLHRYLEKKSTHKRQNEVIPYNDCLYRNMNRYKFVVLLDTDEVIMPKTTLSWTALMEQVAPEATAGLGHPKSSYVALHVYFLDAMQEEHGWATDVPRFMHMLQHVQRAANHTAPGSYVKCFHDPQRVETLHNHFPVSCVGEGCSYQNLPEELAHLQHYRKWCAPELKKSCEYFVNHTVRDDTILRFREPLMGNTLKALSQAGLVGG